MDGYDSDDNDDDDNGCLSGSYGEAIAFQKIVACISNGFVEESCNFLMDEEFLNNIEPRHDKLSNERATLWETSLHNHRMFRFRDLSVEENTMVLDIFRKTDDAILDRVVISKFNVRMTRRDMLCLTDNIFLYPKVNITIIAIIFYALLLKQRFSLCCRFLFLFRLLTSTL